MRGVATSPRASARRPGGFSLGRVLDREGPLRRRSHRPSPWRHSPSIDHIVIEALHAAWHGVLALGPCGGNGRCRYPDMDLSKTARTAQEPAKTKGKATGSQRRSGLAGQGTGREQANKKPGIDLTGLFVGCATCCCSVCWSGHGHAGCQSQAMPWGRQADPVPGMIPPHPVVAASSSAGWCGRTPCPQAPSWILVACLPLGPWMISKDTR